MNWKSLVFVDADASALQTVGVSLVHFAWQGVAIALLVAIASSVTGLPRVRYAIGIVGMLLMIACPIATGILLRSWAEASRHDAAMTLPSPAQMAGLEGITIFDEDLSNLTAADLELRLDDPALAAPAAQPPTEDTQSHWQRLPAGLAIAWLVVVALLLLKNAFALLALARLRRDATPVTDAALLRSFRSLARTIGLRAAPPLLACHRVAGPCVVGLIRPAVLWPAALLSGLTPGQVEALLAHELAHVRRLDPLVNHLQTLAETLLFFHPCVWWLGRRVRSEREACCDALAAETLEGDRIGVADALVALASLQQSRLASPQLSLGARDGTIASRVKRLIDGDAPVQRSPIALALVALALLAGTAYAMQDDRQETPPASDVLTTQATQPTTAPSTDEAPAAVALRTGETIELRLNWNDFSDPVSLGTYTIDGLGQITLPLRGGTKVVAAGKTTDELQTLLLKTYNEGRDIADARPIYVRRVAPRPIASLPREMPAGWLRSAMDEDARLGTLRDQLDRTDTELAVEMARNGERSRRARELTVTRDVQRQKVANREVEVRELAEEAYAERLRSIADGAELPDAFDWSTGRVADARGAESRTLRLQKQLDAIQIEIEVERATGSDASQRLKQLAARREAIAARLAQVAAEEAKQKEIERAEAAERERRSEAVRVGGEDLAQMKIVAEQLASRLNDLRVKHADLRTQLGAAHPTVRRFEAEIEATEIGLSEVRQKFGAREFYIAGAVARPGVYALSDRPMTLRQGLIAAGIDVEADAVVVLRRRNPATGDEDAIQRSVQVLLEDGSQDLTLVVGDQIIVKRAEASKPTPEPATKPAATN